MTTTHTLKMVSPDGTTTRFTTPTDIIFDTEAQEPSTLECIFQSEWDVLFDESDTTNPGQLNAYVEYSRGGTIIFRGYIFNRELVQGASGEQLIKIICTDVVGKLAATLASVGGDSTFSLSTPYDEINEYELKQATAIGDSLYPFYPLPAAGGGDGNPWLSQASDWAVSTTLGANMDAGGTYAITGVLIGGGGWFQISGDETDKFIANLRFKVTGSTNNDGDWTVASSSFGGGNTTIVVASDESVGATPDGVITITSFFGSASQAGITPAGLVMIGTEWIQYDGYDDTPDTSKYMFKSITRGALGTTKATHAAAVTIYQMVSQKIHPALPVIVEVQRSGTAIWDVVPTKEYAVQVEEGRFDVSYDILAFIEPGNSTAKWDEIRASYTVFDEDHADAVTLGTVFNDVLTATVANGGPGLAGGQIDLGSALPDVEALANIRLSRVNLEEPENTLTFMQNLLDDIGLARNSTTDAIILRYDHENDKVICKIFDQSDNAAAHIFHHPTLIDRGIDIEDVFSAVEIVYDSGEKNLAHWERMWHPDRGDTVGTLSAAISGFMYQDEEHIKMAGWNIDETSNGNNLYTKRLTDGRKETGWGLDLDTVGNPGTTADCLLLWFDDDVATYVIDKVSILVDCRRHSHPTNPFIFRVLAVENFTDVTSDPPTYDAPVFFAGSMYLAFPASSHLDAMNQVEVKGEDIAFSCEGLLFRWDGMATRAGAYDNFGNTDIRHCLLKEIEVIGRRVRSKLVQLTDNFKLGSDFLYAPTSYAKLIDANMGQPRVKILEVGTATENVARSLGRLALLQSLVLEHTRTYEIKAGKGQEIGAIPKLTELVTAQDPEDASRVFTGTVMGVNFTNVGGEEILTLRLLDYDSGLI